MEYLNRYNDVFTFTKDEENNVLWEGIETGYKIITKK